VVICVHGTLDRARSFTRVARRLEHLDVLAYDRRGYRASRSVGASASLPVHIDDLLATVELVRARGPVTVFGHSLGGLIAISAALSSAGPFDALIAYEAPLGWLVDPSAVRPIPQGDPGDEAEAFFKRVASSATWDHMSADERAERRADGPALIADLTMSRSGAPFSLDDLRRLEMPICAAIGTASTDPRFARGAEIVVAEAPRSTLAVLDGAAHGAHLASPDKVAQLIERIAHGAQARTDRVRT
jgi:pimeloyl-ACP methyl ester carboxylesterase